MFEYGLHHYFLNAMDRFSTNIAIVSKNSVLTYKALDEQSNQLANLLQEAGIKEHDVVAFSLSEGMEQIIAILAIMKINATYLPINDDTPRQRVVSMLSIADCHCILTDNIDYEGIVSLFLKYSKLNAFVANPPKKPTKVLAPAYIIFTSGSTGKPKGVLMSHKGPLNTVNTMDDLFNLTSEDSIIQNASIGFDPSVWLIFWPLRHGAKIIIPDNTKDVDHLCQLVEQYQVRLLHAGPALFSGLLYSERFKHLNCLRLVIGGGQAWQLHHLKTLSQVLPQCGFCNVYGPTEASIHVTVWLLSADKLRTINAVSIGCPIKNMQVFVLNDNLLPVEQGEPGELCVAGVGLADGYINQEELTQQVFVNVNNDTRIYRTGDRVRMEVSGELTFLGRQDEQVQIRGYRVELVEVEKVLQAVEGVKEVVVLVQDKTDSNVKLLAFVCGTKSVKLDVLNQACKEAVKKMLPVYMRPSSISMVQEIPLNMNAKPDREALLAQYMATLVPEIKEPGDTQTLISIWENVLNKKIDSHSDFFEMGGDSLDALKLVANINSQFNISLSVMDVFENPVVDTLLKKIATLTSHGFSENITNSERFSHDNLQDVNICPLSDNQRWLLALAEVSPAMNNLVIPLEVQGVSSIHKLESVLLSITARHDILRANLLKSNSDKLIFREESGDIFEHHLITDLSNEQKKIYIECLCEKLNETEIDLFVEYAPQQPHTVIHKNNM